MPDGRRIQVGLLTAVLWPTPNVSDCNGARTPEQVAAILERSLNEVVQRHEILRTTFAEVDGKCVQVITPQLNVHLTSTDLHALPRSKKKTLGHKLIQEEMLHSFDLAQGPLFRFHLVHLAKREHLLLITIHGIIVDGWSLGVLVDEIFTLYDAFYARAASPFAPLSFQFADFAQWQRGWRSHPDIAAREEVAIAAWRAQAPSPERLHYRRRARN